MEKPPDPIFFTILIITYPIKYIGRFLTFSIIFYPVFYNNQTIYRKNNIAKYSIVLILGAVLL